MSSTSSDSGLPPLTRPPLNGSITGDHGDHDRDHETSEDEFETVVSKRTKQQQQKSRRYYKERHYHKPWAGGGGKHGYNKNNNNNNQFSHDHSHHNNHNHHTHGHGHGGGHGGHDKDKDKDKDTHHNIHNNHAVVVNGHGNAHGHHNTSESEPEITNVMAMATTTTDGSTASTVSSPTSPTPGGEKAFTEAPPPAVNPWKIHRNAAQVLVKVYGTNNTATNTNTSSNKQPSPTVTNSTIVANNAKVIENEVKSLENRTTAITISSPNHKNHNGSLSPSTKTNSNVNAKRAGASPSPISPKPHPPAPVSKVATTTNPNATTVPGPTPASTSASTSSITVPTDFKPSANIINTSTSHCSTNGQSSQSHGFGHAKGWGKVPLNLPVKSTSLTASSADWPSLDEALKVVDPTIGGLENGFGGKGTSVRSSCSSSTCTGTTADSHSLDEELGGLQQLQAEDGITMVNTDKERGYTSDEKKGTGTGTSTPTSKKSSKPKWVPLELEEPVQTKTEPKPRKKKFPLSSSTTTNNNQSHHPNQNGYKNQNGTGSPHAVTVQLNGIEPNQHIHNHVDNYNPNHNQNHAPIAAAGASSPINSQPARVNNSPNNNNNSRPPFRNSNTSRRNPNSNNNNHFHHNNHSHRNGGGGGYHKNFNHHTGGGSMERDFTIIQDFLPPPFPEFTPLQLEGFVMPYAGVLPLAGAGPIVPPVGPLVDNQVLLQCVQNQIEYYLSEENLEKDFFLRRKMDSEGYIPISLISSFNRLRCLTMDPDIIVQAITNSEHIEMVDGFIRPAIEPTKWPVPDIVTCKILAEQSFAHFVPTIPLCPTTEHPSGTLTPSASTSTAHHHHTTQTRNFLLMLNEPRTRRNSM